MYLNTIFKKIKLVAIFTVYKEQIVCLAKSMTCYLNVLPAVGFDLKILVIYHSHSQNLERKQQH